MSSCTPFTARRTAVTMSFGRDGERWGRSRSDVGGGSCSGAGRIRVGVTLSGWRNGRRRTFTCASAEEDQRAVSMSSPSGPLTARKASNMICAASTSSAANISSSSRSPSAGPPVNPASCQFSTILSFTAAPVALEGGIARDGSFDGANETKVARGVRWRAQNGVRRRANRARGRSQRARTGPPIARSAPRFYVDTTSMLLSGAEMGSRRGRTLHRLASASLADGQSPPPALSSRHLFHRPIVPPGELRLHLLGELRAKRLSLRPLFLVAPLRGRPGASASPSTSASGDARPDSA